jgi:hypothetical protein
VTVKEQRQTLLEVADPEPLQIGQCRSLDTSQTDLVVDAFLKHLKMSRPGIACAAFSCKTEHLIIEVDLPLLISGREKTGKKQD